MISLGRQSRAALFLTIAGAVSCSVKEDRSVCPCYVTLDFAPAVEAGLGDASLLVGNRSGLAVEDVDISSLVDGTLEIAVPRGRTGFSAVFGDEGYTLDGDTLRFDGTQTPGRLFVWSEYALCDDDAYSCRVQPHKQFCDIEVVLVQDEQSPLPVYAVDLKAGCDALSLFDLEAVEGNLSAAAVYDAASLSYRLRIPRQKPGPLVLGLYDTSLPVRIPLMLLDISRELEIRGYDWGKPDLDDIRIVIDRQAVKFSVNIVGWTSENSIHVEI